MFDAVDYYFLSDDKLLRAKINKEESVLPDFSLVYKMWAIFWEELKLKYAMFLQHLDLVQEDDILTFSFLGFTFFGKFKIRST